jgi:hypothetical protein
MSVPQENASKKWRDMLLPFSIFTDETREEIGMPVLADPISNLERAKEPSHHPSPQSDSQEVVM